MNPGKDSVGKRILEGLNVLTVRGLGRSSLLAAAAAPFFAARSPGAALLFVLLPAYAVLRRGSFSAAEGGGAPPDSSRGPIPPKEAIACLAAAILASGASLGASLAGFFLARRFMIPSFASPWGLGSACVASSLALVSVYLPVLALWGRAAGRTAAGALFAAAGVLAALSALRDKSMYAAFLWILYSGSVPGLYPPLLAGTALLSGLSGAVSWSIARKKSLPPRLS